MKRLFFLPFLSIICFFSNYTFTQVVPELEVMGTFLTTNTASFKGKGGYGLGLNVSIFDDKRFNLVVGASFVRNYFWIAQLEAGKFGTFPETTSNVTSINIPILVRYNTAGTTKFIAELGPTVEIPFNYSSYYVAGHAAVGVKFPVGNNDMIAKAFYRYTPGYLSRDPQEKEKSNTSYVGISLAYRLKIGK